MLSCLLFFIYVERFGIYFHFHPPHLFVVSKEAFIVRSACSAAADGVCQVIVICNIVIKVIILFSPNKYFQNNGQRNYAHSLRWFLPHHQIQTTLIIIIITSLTGIVIVTVIITIIIIIIIIIIAINLWPQVPALPAVA